MTPIGVAAIAGQRGTAGGQQLAVTVHEGPAVVVQAHLELEGAGAVTPVYEILHGRSA